MHRIANSPVLFVPIASLVGMGTRACQTRVESVIFGIPGIFLYLGEILSMEREYSSTKRKTLYQSIHRESIYLGPWFWEIVLKKTISTF